MITISRWHNVDIIIVMVVIKLSEVMPGKHGYNIYVKVLESKHMEVKRIDNSVLEICEGIVGDETSRINFRIVGKHAPLL